MEKNRKKLIYGSTALTLVVIGIVVGMMISQSLLAPIMPDRFWRSAAAADGDPGVGESGMLEIFIYPHSADPYTDYATNLTAAAAYANTSNWNRSADGEVPYAPTTFDIVVKARFNSTHAYNSSGAGAWATEFVRANITCATLSIVADTAMSKVHVYNSSSSGGYMWVQFFINNADAGYTISHGQTVNVTSIKLQAYY